MKAALLLICGLLLFALLVVIVVAALLLHAAFEFATDDTFRLHAPARLQNL